MRVSKSAKNYHGNWYSIHPHKELLLCTFALNKILVAIQVQKKTYRYGVVIRKHHWEFVNYEASYTGNCTARWLADGHQGGYITQGSIVWMLVLEYSSGRTTYYILAPRMFRVLLRQLNVLPSTTLSIYHIHSSGSYKLSASASA